MLSPFPNQANYIHLTLAESNDALIENSNELLLLTHRYGGNGDGVGSELIRLQPVSVLMRNPRLLTMRRSNETVCVSSKNDLLLAPLFFFSLRLQQLEPIH